MFAVFGCGQTCTCCFVVVEVVYALLNVNDDVVMAQRDSKTNIGYELKVITCCPWATTSEQAI